MRSNKITGLLVLAIFAAGVVSAKPLLTHVIRPLDEGSGELSWEIQDGLLTAIIAGDGPHQAHIRWDVPTVAEMPDLKSFDISFGTASGTYNVLQDYNIAAGGNQPGANEILVKGLNSSTAYYWKVRARDSEDNVGSYCAEQTCTSEAAWTPPESPIAIDQSDFPLSCSTDTNYQLSENIVVASGTALTLASGATIDFNGFTITVGTSAEGTGISYPASCANTRLYDTQGGGGITVGSSGRQCIGIAGNLGSGNIIQDIALVYDGDSTLCIDNYSGDYRSLGGMRIFNVSWVMQQEGGSPPATFDSGGVFAPHSLKVYGCDFDMDSDDNRTYLFGDTRGELEVWECTANIANTTARTATNHAFHADYFGTSKTYMHDLDVTVSAYRCRIFFPDGASANKRYTWINLDMSAADNNGATTTGFHIRNAGSGPSAGNLGDITKNVAIGFNTIELGGSTEVTSAIEVAGYWTDMGSGAAWNTAYIYHNTVNGVGAARQGLRLSEDHDEVYVWDVSLNRHASFTSGFVFGWSGAFPTSESDQYFNRVTASGADPVFDGAPSTQTQIDVFVYDGWGEGGGADDDSRITYSETWVGYDPNGDSIPTPTGMTQVTGVH